MAVWETHTEAALPDGALPPVVRALQALRGMALVAAGTVIAELGDITRYFGFVPVRRVVRHHDARYCTS